MKIGELIKKLITCDNYFEERIKVDDSVIDMIREFMPRDYDYLKEREESYQEFTKLMKYSK